MKLRIFAAAAVLVILVSVQKGEGMISDTCLNCIHTVEGGKEGCRMDRGSLSCGPYQIKEPYWIDCGSLGTSWKSCANSEGCARDCVRRYTERYAGICKSELRVTELSCCDYGRLHNGGPYGCSKASTLAYVNAMRQKCHLDKSC